MKTENLGMMLDETCGRYPDRSFLTYKDTRYTFEDLDRAVGLLGRRLMGFGIARGDKVAIMLPNIPEFIAAYFAVLKLGGVAVTVNVASTPYELTYLLNNSDARAFITTPQGAKRYGEMKNEAPGCPHLITVDDTDDGFSMDKAGTGTAERIETVAMKADDPAVMIYTSGLTGKPLGAVLTHGNLLTQSILLRDVCNGTKDDKGLCLIPLYHSFGATVNMLMILKIGAGLVMMDQFNLETIFRAIETEGVTYIAAVPRLYLGMLLYPDADNYDLSSLRFCITGGSKMPPEHISPFREKFGVILMEGYGLTEASPVCSVNRMNMVNKPGSIGIPIPEVQARIVDDTDRELAPGEVGELLIKGPNVMKGYYKAEEATEEVLKNGWLYTRDLGYIDTEGYIFLTGLKKRLIITSGFNVYPKEVEDILDLHPAVAASRVVGKEDLMRGEIVKAFIIRKDQEEADEKDIIRHSRTYLSAYKCPREVEFVTEFD